MAIYIGLNHPGDRRGDGNGVACADDECAGEDELVGEGNEGGG